MELLGRVCSCWAVSSDIEKDFVVSGTTSEQLFGVCESFWRPGEKLRQTDTGEE